VGSLKTVTKQGWTTARLILRRSHGRRTDPSSRLGEIVNVTALRKAKEAWPYKEGMFGLGR